MYIHVYSQTSYILLGFVARKFLTVCIFFLMKIDITKMELKMNEHLCKRHQEVSALKCTDN